MHKQTIEVSRELLEESWSALMLKGCVLSALKIRALLDHPAQEVKQQGEAVAYLRQSDLIRLAQPHVAGCAASLAKKPASGFVAIYTEQPAPVAVVLPDDLRNTMHSTIRNYRMGTLGDGEGGGYPLIDAMSADGESVAGGIEECQYLADAIFDACAEELIKLNGLKP